MGKVTSLYFENPPEITSLPAVDGIEISVLRLDKIDTISGGNKGFKLKYNLEEAKLQGYSAILTLGGAYSNHIAATALAGKEAGFKTIGIIRGEELKPDNITLKTAADNGMDLRFVDRTLYRLYCDQENLLMSTFKDIYCIPEGGANDLAVKGCREILENIKSDFDVVVSAVGTGTTLAGLTLALKPHQRAIGISVLKGAEFIDENVKHWIINGKGNPNQFSIHHNFHFGGYAKQDAVLQQFVDDFNANHSFKIEAIYTGKMFYALYDLVKSNHFEKGMKILAIHTGGLQYLKY